MDKRLILTERQSKLVEELRMLFRELLNNDGSYIATFKESDLIYSFFNAEHIDYIDSLYRSDADVFDDCIYLDPFVLEHCRLNVELISTDPVFRLENNQYVKDRILKEVKKVSETRKHIALHEALGDDGRRLQEIKQENKERAIAGRQLQEELERWKAVGNARMVEITLQDIETNRYERARLNSEAIRLGKVVAKKTREFLNEYKAD